MPFFAFRYRRFWRWGDWQAAVLTGIFLWGLYRGSGVCFLVWFCAIRRQREKSPLDSRLLHGNLYGGEWLCPLFCIRVFQQYLTLGKHHQNFGLLVSGWQKSLYLICHKIAILELGKCIQLK